MSHLEKQKERSFFVNLFSCCTKQSKVMTFLFVLVCSQVVQSKRTETYSQQKIAFCYNKKNFEGKRLNTTVYIHLVTKSEFDCGFKCYEDPCCRSANFQKLPPYTYGGKNCELLQAIESEERGNLTENVTYNYLILVQPIRLLDSNCLSCQNGASSKDAAGNCECRSGFKGRLCENAIVHDRYNSTILDGNSTYLNKLDEWLAPTTNSWCRCYEATGQSAWSAEDFHSGCDEKPETLTLVLYENNIIGGYSDIRWKGKQDGKSSAAFLFVLKSQYRSNPFKLSLVKSPDKKAIYRKPEYGPTFGEGYDFHITETSCDSFTKFGKTYQLPSGVPPSNVYNEKKFCLSKIEVFYKC